MLIKNTTGVHCRSDESLSHNVMLDFSRWHGRRHVVVERVSHYLRPHNVNVMLTTVTVKLMLLLLSLGLKVKSLSFSLSCRCLCTRIARSIAADTGTDMIIL